MLRAREWYTFTDKYQYVIGHPLYDIHAQVCQHNSKSARQNIQLILYASRKPERTKTVRNSLFPEIYLRQPSPSTAAAHSPPG